MKVLGIAAGRKNGNGEILLKEALLACQEAGAEVKMINLFDYEILPCTGCEGLYHTDGQYRPRKADKIQRLRTEE